MRLKTRYQELLQDGLVSDRRAVVFAYPKIKIRFVLPLPEFPIYSFEPFQPFFLSFEDQGITLFPLDLNHQYERLNPIVMPWEQIKQFHFHSGVLQHTITLAWKDSNMIFRVPKYKVGESWLKENLAYLYDHDYFYREWKLENNNPITKRHE
jgi:hypothetical protein